MDASSTGTSVYIILIPFAFFSLWLILAQEANPKAVMFGRLSTRQYVLSLIPLVAITGGLSYPFLMPGAVAALAPSPPVRMARPLVPPPAPVADPPRLPPSGPGRAD